MENHFFTHKVSRIFPSSFTSCRLKTATDVVETSIVTTQNLHENRPSRNQFPKINVPKDDKTATMLFGYFSPSIDGRRCPPVTPISTVHSCRNLEPPDSGSSSSNGGGNHHETKVFFTSAVSSESLKDEAGKVKEEISEEEFDYYTDFPGIRRKTKKPYRKIKKSRWRGGTSWCAIEKSTSDPYGEFRKSMVEMIVEKQIFGAEDLKRLLHCFLSLNSPYFHEVIVDVYLEIIETLFSN